MNANTQQSGAELSQTASQRSILVCFAVEEEAEPFRRLAAGNPHIRVAVTGMGRRNAERALKALISRNVPDFVVTAGFAGGLRAGLTTGTVLVEGGPAHWTPETFQATGAVRAKFYCADRVVTTAAQKRVLREQTGADAVEMESRVICELCRAANVPCATVRVILDTAEEDLPLDFNALMTADDRLNGWKLAGMLLKQPSKIAELLRFRMCCRQAAKSLAEVLGKLLCR